MSAAPTHRPAPRDPSASAAAIGERTHWRRQQVRDAARLLPVFGLALFLLPLIWSIGTEAPASTILVRLFVGWAVLIVVGRALARRLSAQQRAFRRAASTPNPTPPARDDFG